MAKAQRSETFDVAIDKIYNVIVDYASYPEFVEGVSSVEVLEQNDQGARVKYSLNLIKKFSYILTLKHDKPNRVSWDFESGDLFKVNSGSWELKDNGNSTTDVTYSLEVDVKGFVPKAIINKLTESSLPAMMKSYCQRAKGQ
ncbi:SRPBCC family protein [Halobacteriovorax sp. GB3]|uniref:type II toxin-antitoxin system RatA family toxin n=1 Tax=Halobacteriovorax sp. GB3 TaxID=2719615 RepID=UPI0023613E7C|nr:SRPBCC family protein [Halobacteriovorax sp. GB3]MDD0853069.1 SRPBCC family protein [Halobacteriovorax sp. GB3]